MKRVAIVQSNYIPWKGYFDLIASVDEFVLFDDMQFTRRDWRNRNLIKTPSGPQWLTVPVAVKGRFTQPIRETAIQGNEWVETHLRSFRANYARAPHFKSILALLEPAYRQGGGTISKLNRAFLERICGYLGIVTRLSNSWDYELIGDRSERLAELCRQAGGQIYVSGPAARDYLDEAPFAARNISVEWFDYGGYPEYPQLWGAFEHGVSIVDLMFNCGRDAPRYMKQGGWVSEGLLA